MIRYVRPKEINMTDKKRKKNPNSYKTLPYSNVPFAILLFGDLDRAVCLFAFNFEEIPVKRVVKPATGHSLDSLLIF